MEDLLGSLFPIIIIVVVLSSIVRNILRRGQDGGRREPHSESPQDERHQPPHTPQAPTETAGVGSDHASSTTDAPTGSGHVDEGRTGTAAEPAPTPAEPGQRDIARELEKMLSHERRSEQPPEQPAAEENDETIETSPSPRRDETLPSITARRRSSRDDLLDFLHTGRGLRQALLTREVLGPPRALRPVEDDEGR